MRTTVTADIRIAADITEVFEYLTNLKYHYLWNPQVSSISTTDHLKLGSAFDSESRILGATVRATNIVTEYESPKALSFVSKIGSVEYNAQFKLHTEGKETAVDLSLSVDNAPPVIRKLPESILQQVALREIRTDLQALKIAVENYLK